MTACVLTSSVGNANVLLSWTLLTECVQSRRVHALSGELTLCVIPLPSAGGALGKKAGSLSVGYFHWSGSKTTW